MATLTLYRNRLSGKRVLAYDPRPDGRVTYYAEKNGQRHGRLFTIASEKFNERFERAAD